MCGPWNASTIPPLTYGKHWHYKPDAQATPKVGPIDNVWYYVFTSTSDAVCSDVSGEVGCVDCPSALEGRCSFVSSKTTGPGNFACTYLWFVKICVKMGFQMMDIANLSSILRFKSWAGLSYLLWKGDRISWSGRYPTPCLQSARGWGQAGWCARWPLCRYRSLSSWRRPWPHATGPSCSCLESAVVMLGLTLSCPPPVRAQNLHPWLQAPLLCCGAVSLSFTNALHFFLSLHLSWTHIRW